MVRSIRTGRLAVLAAAATAMAGGAQAQEVIEAVTNDGPLGIEPGLAMLWTIIAGAMVFFMQAGFAAVEAGFTRAKNVCNILMKNLMDFSVGTIAFLFLGFGFMFGITSNGWIGTSFFGLTGLSEEDMPGTLAFWFFQSVFAATACTIVSGAMAERTKFVGYLAYTVIISIFIYPIFGKWAWGSLLTEEGLGWLEADSIAFYDFAGSTVVHSVGGWAALWGAWILGPRMGKFVDGKPRAILGHSIPLAALGTFILWFGWFGFNAGSTTDGGDSTLGLICANTSLSASAGAIGAMLTSWAMFKKPDTGMSLNGSLAGLVGITAGCDALVPMTAVIVGLVSGIIVVLSVIGIERFLKVDDPVGAISVHGVCGAWGTMAVAIFSDSATILGQAIGVVSAFVWVSITAIILFTVLKKSGILRASDEEQREGLDIGEHANEGYPSLSWGTAGPGGI